MRSVGQHPRVRASVDARASGRRRALLEARRRRARGVRVVTVDGAFKGTFYAHAVAHVRGVWTRDATAHGCGGIFRVRARGRAGGIRARVRGAYARVGARARVCRARD